MNETEKQIFYNRSAQILVQQAPANFVWLLMCVVGLILNLIQLFMILFYKPLRSRGQFLVFFVAFTDLIKHLSHGAVSIKRLHLYFLGAAAVDDQWNCILYLALPNIFTENISRASVVVLSLDRMLAMAFPTWYRQRIVSLKVSMVFLSFVFVSLGASCAFIGVSVDVLNIACTVQGSVTHVYGIFVAWSNYAVGIVVLLINFVTLLVLFLRWRRVQKTEKSLQDFKRTFKLKALRCVMALVGIYVFSLVAGSILEVSVSSSKLDVGTKTALGPVNGCVYFIGGGFDLVVYLVFNTKYQDAFRKVIRKLKCKSSNVETTPVIPIA